VVFVGDSLAGNDAIEQAVAFDKAVGIDAVILTKIDTDAKGGRHCPSPTPSGSP
jgi:fused signal recognition particle receptor